jgi:hypothetical protein
MRGKKQPKLAKNKWMDDLSSSFISFFLKGDVSLPAKATDVLSTCLDFN